MINSRFSCVRVRASVCSRTIKINVNPIANTGIRLQMFYCFYIYIFYIYILLKIISKFLRNGENLARSKNPFIFCVTWTKRKKEGIVGAPFVALYQWGTTCPDHRPGTTYVEINPRRRSLDDFSYLSLKKEIVIEEVVRCPERAFPHYQKL